jgi:hypothetical protein
MRSLLVSDLVKASRGHRDTSSGFLGRIEPFNRAIAAAIKVNAARERIIRFTVAKSGAEM